MFKQLNLRQLLYGIATFLPGIPKVRYKKTGGTNSARYCYSVWLRHLVLAKKNKLNVFPKAIAELGPGDSLGIGIAGLISGAEKYFAFDVIEYANSDENLKIFYELVGLFKNQENIPNDKEFPKLKPYLDSYKFPQDIFNNERLHYMLSNERLERIKDSILNINKNYSMIHYKVPWYNEEIIQNETIDMIFSQAVLEHVENLEDTYKKMFMWLKPLGYISHQIDFKSHGLSKDWNGHWTYSDFLWSLIKGKRPYLINREPHSAHISILKKIGFKIVCDLKVISESNISQNKIAKRFKYLKEDDLKISGAFIQAIKN